MSVKLNSFVLSDNIIKKMDIQLDKTRDIGIEYGFNLCKDNDNIVVKDECTGTTCEIKIMRECSNQEITPKVGDYHTHPRGTSEMSIMDMKRACLFDFKCIGTVTDNSIKCFIRKKVKYPEKCSKEMDAIIKKRDVLARDAEILRRNRSMLPNIGEYKDIIKENEIKVRQHNEKVSDSIRKIAIIKDTYFEGIIIR